jgi:glycosyltransferase involved in cell wall biosynthesis
MRLIYFSPVPWASFAQRPHKFVEWFHARTGDEVLWIDPYPARFPKLDDIRRLKRRNDVFQPNTPKWLAILKPTALPIEPLPASGILNRLFWGKPVQIIFAFAKQGKTSIGFGKPSALALQVSKALPGMFEFYDAMDNFPAFHSGLSRISMEKRECEMADRVARILVSSFQLTRRFSQHSSKISIALNACDTLALPPVESLIHHRSQLVVGYLGTISNWFDWPLVVDMACQNPKVIFRLIGPMLVPPPGALPDNIEILPPCSHSEAIKAMQSFSIGLIPFKISALTEYVDPIKYYEFRALGLPVISTRFGEMARRCFEPGVFLIEKTADFRTLIDAVLAYNSNGDEIEAFRTENNWSARFDSAGLLL